MVEMDYMIMYTSDGIPIYSFKFNPEFDISDDILLSALLTSLNSFSQTDIEDRPEFMMLDEKEIQIHYSDELNLSTIELENNLLVFYHGEGSNLSIGVGIAKKVSAYNTLFSVTQMMVELDQFMVNYVDLDWRDVETRVLEEFEHNLHTQIIHRFVPAHTADDDCYLDEGCPYRHAEIPEEPPKSLRDRIRSRFGRG